MNLTEKGIRASLIDQAASCEALGSPFTGRLCRLLSARLDPASLVGRHVFGWRGDYSARADNVALRLCGALHQLALTRTDDTLAKVYPPEGGLADETDEIFWNAIAAALETHNAAVIDFLASAPQTNEIRRSAVLIPAYHAVAAKFGLPIAMHELGASAGLNLYPDKYGLKTDKFSINPESKLVLTPEWRGEIPHTGSLEIISKQACDLSPVDIDIPENEMRMLAYIWPDQIDRIERTKAAMRLAQANSAHTVDKEDAVVWLELALKRRKKNVASVFHHTIAWQYFPPELQRKGEQLFDEYGTLAGEENPIVRISMESDGGGVDVGAKLTLTVWPSGTSYDLGRADFHGRWVDWKNPG